VPVVWRAKALADVSRIVRYIATNNPVAARKVGPSCSSSVTAWNFFRTAADRDGKPGHANWW
jgi:hypothetical protein